MKEDEGGWWTASELPVTRCDQPGLVPLPCFPLFLAVRFHGQRDGFFFYAARRFLSFFYRSEDRSQTDEGALCPARCTTFNRRGIRRLSRRPLNLRVILVRCPRRVCCESCLVVYALVRSTRPPQGASQGYRYPQPSVFNSFKVALLTSPPPSLHSRWRG